MTMPIGEIHVEYGLGGLAISLIADKKYLITNVQDPNVYHLIVVSYQNDVIWVRIDDHFYDSILVKGEIKQENVLSIHGDQTSGEFKDLRFYDVVHDRFKL